MQEIKLFCRECSTYLGPGREQCPQCGLKPEEPIQLPGRGQPVWKEPVRLDGYPAGRPVFSHGLVLTAWKKGKFGGGVAAIELSGRLRWQVNTTETPLDGILVDGDHLYFCTAGLLEGGSAYCCKINTRDPGGEILWQQNHPAIFRGRLEGKPLLRDNRLYITSRDGNIICLDASCGENVPGWVGQVERDTHWLMGLNRHILAICRESGRVLQIDAMRGRQDAPAINLNTRLSCAPLLWKEKIYVGSDDGRIIIVDLRRQSVEDFATGLKKIVARPIVKNGYVIAGSQDHHVYAWHENGQTAWKSDFSSEHAISSSPAANAEILAIGANDGKIYGMDINTGRKVWVFNTGLEDGLARDVLYHDDVFYVGVSSRDDDRGYLFALPWHLGEYETVAGISVERGKHLEAGSLYAGAAYHSIKNRETFGDTAAACWIEAGKPRLAVKYWEGMANPKKAAQCWELAAEDLRGKDNISGAEYYIEASRMYWRLGDPAGEARCYAQAVELGRWPRLRLQAINNPVQSVGKPGPLTVRMENIGYAQAEGIHFDVGGSLLEPISFNLHQPLDPDRHCDMSFIISPTREDDNVRVEVSYCGEGRSIPFTSQLEINVLARKVTRIKLNDMVNSEVRILNEEGRELEIETGDMVMSRLEIITQK